MTCHPPLSRCTALFDLTRGKLTVYAANPRVGHVIAQEALQ